MTRRLSIGITTRNRPDALEACLRSLDLLAHLEPEIFVFDDRSDPPASQVIAAVAPHVRCLGGPAGTAAGRNLIVRQAAADYVLLLDDDTLVLDAAAVEAGLQTIAADPRIGAIAFAQAHGDGSPWPAQMQPSVVTQPSVITAFIGFAHLVRRSTFLALGGYRERFVYQGEEKEFCLRLVDAGYWTVYLPGALIAHVSNPKARDAVRYLRLVSRNDCLNSLYNDPLLRVVWMVPARLFLYLRMRRGWRIHDPGGFWWLVRDVARQLLPVWKERRPVQWSTIRAWRALRQPRPYAQPSAAR